MSPAAYAADILLKLPSSVAHSAILGGGALRAYFDKTPVRDYDLFFRSLEDFQDARRTLFRAGWPVDSSSHLAAPTFTDPAGNQWNLIGFHFGDETQHYLRFDFHCCRMVAWFADKCICFASDTYAIEDATDKQLFVCNNNGTERTLKRR